MWQKIIPLLVVLVTVCVNLVFAVTGVTTSVACTVGTALQQITDTAFAAN